MYGRYIKTFNQPAPIYAWGRKCQGNFCPSPAEIPSDNSFIFNEIGYRQPGPPAGTPRTALTLEPHEPDPPRTRLASASNDLWGNGTVDSSKACRGRHCEERTPAAHSLRSRPRRSNLPRVHLVTAQLDRLARERDLHALSSCLGEAPDLPPAACGAPATGRSPSRTASTAIFAAIPRCTEDHSINNTTCFASARRVTAESVATAPTR